MTAENAPHGEKSGLAATAVAAMGVVFGDIGTSPLYTMKEVFGGHHPLAVNPDNVLGILSLVFWALTITVSLKYVLFITRADNKGEGGIMALTALALRPGQVLHRSNVSVRTTFGILVRIVRQRPGVGILLAQFAGRRVRRWRSAAKRRRRRSLAVAISALLG